MKKNKGFTLLELLGVIIVLALIAFLVIPSIIKVMKDSKDKLYIEQVNLVLNAAKNYGVENYSELSEYNLTFLTIDKLTSTGFIENDEAIDPRDGSKMEGCVMVSYSFKDKRFNYEYLEECNKNKYANVINISDNYSGNWQAEVIVKIETSYLDKDDDSETTYRYCVSSSKCNPNIGVDKPSGEIRVDVESEHTYVCAVSVTSTGAETEPKCVGPFKVDKTAPNLVIPGDEELDSLVTTYDFTRGVSVSDNVTPAGRISLVRTGNISLGTLGTYTIEYKATDEAGNVAIKRRTVRVVDVTPPEINIAVSGNPFNSDGWALSGFNVNVSATDLGGSGVSGYYYCVANSKCTPSTFVGSSTGIVPANIDGETIYVCAKSIDGAGNYSEETKCIGPKKVDTTDPVCELQVNADSGVLQFGEFYRGNATVSFRTYSSDVASYNVTTGGASYSGNSSATQTTDTEGTTYYGYVKDRAGRTGSCSAIVKRDTTPPTCTLSSPSGWQNSNVTVSFASKSSDVTAYNVTTGGESYDGNNSTTLSSTGTAYGYVKDRVGLTGSCSSSQVYIDRDAPNAPSVTTDGRNATLTGNGDNGDSGCCGGYSVDGGGQQSSNTFTGLGYGEHTAYAWDNAGNKSGGTTFTISPKATAYNGSSSCVWQCKNSDGSNCGEGGTKCNTSKKFTVSSNNASATFTSATQASVRIWGSFNTGSSYLYTGGDNFARYMCLSNHHSEYTGSGNCMSTSQMIKAKNVSWNKNSNVSYDVTLSINNPSGCYDLMIYSASQTRAHITANITNVVCIS